MTIKKETYINYGTNQLLFMQVGAYDITAVVSEAALSLVRLVARPWFPPAVVGIRRLTLVFSR